MQKTIIICEGCRHKKTHGQYFSLVYKTSEFPMGKQEDYCSQGCLVRRLSMILSVLDNGILAKCDIISDEQEASEIKPQPILITGTG